MRRSALLAIDRALQLGLVHLRAAFDAEVARLCVELIARATPGTGFAGAQPAAPPRGDVTRRGARAAARFAATGALLVDGPRRYLLRPAR